MFYKIKYILAHTDRHTCTYIQTCMPWQATMINKIMLRAATIDAIIGGAYQSVGQN
jgi:hypothetical protein